MFLLNRCLMIRCENRLLIKVLDVFVRLKGIMFAALLIYGNAFLGNYKMFLSQILQVHQGETSRARIALACFFTETNERA